MGEDEQALRLQAQSGRVHAAGAINCADKESAGGIGLPGSISAGANPLPVWRHYEA
jgi:hypothetical protein